MSFCRPRRSVWLVAAVCAAFIGGNAAADVNVCALPATALYIYRAPDANATSASSSPTNSNNTSTRAVCWSDNVDKTCLTACSCRQLQYETVGDKSGEPIGMCLNNSMNFKCAESGLSDCSAYRLNADGSSTTTAISEGSSHAKGSSHSQASDAAEIGTSLNDNKDNKDGGLKTWVWVLIVVGIVIAVGLIIFTITWFKNRPKYAKNNNSSVFERTARLDTWRDGNPSDLAYGEVRDSEATTAATARTARTTQPRDTNTSIMSGVARTSYLTYTVGSGSNQAHRFNDNKLGLRNPMSNMSDGSSSIEMHSPAYFVNNDTRGSFAGGGDAGRLTGSSRLSYPSNGSYGSELDSFSSHVTFAESEVGRDTVLQQQQQQQDQQHQEELERAYSYPRKSTEF